MPRQLKNQAGGWVAVAWEEYVGQDASHGATWSTAWDEGNQAVFQVIINWQDGLEFEIEALGYSTFNSNTTTLSRTLPVRHPYKSWMRCERILGVQPVRWDEKSAGFVSGFLSVPAGVPISEYAYLLVTMGFANPKYRVLTDAQLQSLYGANQEWRRFCEVKHRVNAQALTRENGSWYWADGSSTAAGAVPPTRNNAIPAPIGQTLYHDEIHVKWKRLPRRGVYGQSGESDFFNTNILSNWGKVNSTTTLWGLSGNQWSGVLRFVSADATPISSPFDPGAQGLQATSINEYVDLDLVFDWFDPPYGDSAYRGHNLAPNPADNFWYLLTTSNANAVGAPAGQTIYPTADISQVFTLSLT